MIRKLTGSDTRQPKRKLIILIIRSSYFQGKQVHSDWDILVEQEEFPELSVSATSQGGVLVTVKESRTGTRLVR